MKYLLIALFAFPIFLAAQNLDTLTDNSVVTTDVDQEVLIPNPQSFMRDSGDRHGTGNGKSTDVLIENGQVFMGRRGRGHGTGNG